MARDQMGPASDGSGIFASSGQFFRESEIEIRGITREPDT